MKNITVFGNLSKDFEKREAGNSQVYKTSMGVYDGSENGQSKTQWFDIEFWGKAGETLAGLVGKGSKLIVTGELKTREYEGKTYLTVKGNSFGLVGKKEAQEPKEPQEPKEKLENWDKYLNDDIPFAWAGLVMISLMTLMSSGIA